ncbi:hypothetical protein [Tomitella biformata]|uniref:hypothetical protein n=1 Tax=Tomitella biformata TaxID=630403 RepID=UPI0004646470|nr:hypothetical protein [Tomitella biformata]
MQPIDCRLCGNTVLVEKYSNQHTSIQWLEASATSCQRFAERLARGDRLGTDESCSALNASIDGAAAAGEIDLSLRSYPTPGKLG